MSLRVYAVAQAEPDSAEKLDKELGAAVRCGLTDVRKARPTPNLVWFLLTNVCEVDLLSSPVMHLPCMGASQHGCIPACDTLHDNSSGLVRKHPLGPAQVNLENAPEAGLIGEALLFPRCACAHLGISVQRGVRKWGTVPMSEHAQVCLLV